MTTRTPVDLQELAIQRTDNGRPTLAPKRRVVSRYVLPGLLIVGFLSVLGWAARDLYLPRHPVTIVPVYVSLSEIQTGGTPLFNAAGWVEPRPTPIRVAALASGVVEELLVVEDQAVQKGEPIARLVDEDARLSLQQAQAIGTLRKAEIDAAKAAVKAAQTNLEIPAHLELPVAEAEAALAAVETDLSNLPHQLERAQARLRLANVDLQTKKQVRQSLSAIVIEQAQSELDAAQAEVNELTKRRPALEQQRAALVRSRDAAAKRLDLLTEEQQAVAEAKARLEAGHARFQEARVAIDEAQLRLNRMTISSPVDGRILNLIAQPGTQLTSGSSEMENADSSTVVTMYDPQSLQVRVDVRFEDLPRTGRGQPVEIRTPAWSEPLKGEVLFLTGYANIQKNTLEVKVSVDDPPDVFKPEMLVDVTFLAPEVEPTEDESPEQYRLFVPRSLVQQSESGAFVWVADVAARVARRKRVTLGPIETPAFLEVTDGVTAASRLISGGREQLEDGDRINITGEDETAAPAAPTVTMANTAESGDHAASNVEH